jgi:hypothetical protein
MTARLRRSDYKGINRFFFEFYAERCPSHDESSQNLWLVGGILNGRWLSATSSAIAVPNRNIQEMASKFVRNRIRHQMGSHPETVKHGC